MTTFAGVLVLLVGSQNWTPYNTRNAEMPEPKLHEPWSFSVQQGQLDHQDLLTITGDSKGARIERLRRDDKENSTLTRARLTAAQVKTFRENAAALKYWAMVPARTRSGKTGDELAWSTYRVNVSSSGQGGKSFAVSFDLQDTCPCEGCECPQMQLIELVRKTAGLGKPERVASTRTKEVAVGKPKGTPVAAACSEAPTANGQHWCELKRGAETEKFDHCFPHEGGVFSCFATPYSPAQLVKRTAEASGYVPEDEPWALELETGERCTRSAWPSQWSCSGGLRFPPTHKLFRGTPWSLQVHDRLLVVTAIYR